MQLTESQLIALIAAASNATGYMESGLQSPARDRLLRELASILQVVPSRIQYGKYDRVDDVARRFSELGPQKPRVTSGIPMRLRTRISREFPDGEPR